MLRLVTLVQCLLHWGAEIVAVPSGMPLSSPFTSGCFLFAPLHQWIAYTLPCYQHGRSLSQHSHKLPLHPHKAITNAENERDTPGSFYMNLLFDLPLLSLSLYRISASLTWKHLDNKKYIFAWEWTTN